MKSVTTEQFRQLYAKAPKERQLRIRRAYKLWTVDPKHPSLRFKKVHNKLPIYSARFDLDWRAVGVWDYPDSVDSRQGSTGVSVWVLMDTCS